MTPSPFTAASIFAALLTAPLLYFSTFPVISSFFAFPVSRGKRPGIPGNQVWLFLLFTANPISCFLSILYVLYLGFHHDS
jgi:hypothetical protein